MGTNCRAYCSVHREKNAPKTWDFLVVLTVLVSSITEVPADVNTLIPVTGPDLDMIGKNCLLVISHIENSLVLSILCIKEYSCFLP